MTNYTLFCVYRYGKREAGMERDRQSEIEVDRERQNR